jgi:DUF971 family protein
VNGRYEPRVITKSDPTRVVLEWADGHRRTLDVDGVPADIVTRGVSLVGNYAITILFSDGHGTGIYPFRMLRDQDPDG